MIELHRLRWHQRELHTRIPFHYGIAVMERVPHVWLEIEATVEGERLSGQSADHLPPKWFTKDPARALDDEIAEMQFVLAAAGAGAVGTRAATVHRLVQQVEAQQEAWAKSAGIPALLAHFGVSFVERALIDAYCRRYATTVGEVLRRNGLGIDLADLHPELAGTCPNEGLPAASLSRVVSRHTVGLTDPLEEADVNPANRPPDDLPVSLREVCRRYGSREFKIKVAGESAAILDRLERVVQLVEAETGGDWLATIDGNESFRTIESFRSLWDQMSARDRLAPLWSRLRFVEQPLHRSAALDPAVGEALRDWPKRPPMLIDESGATPGDLRTALERGYIGVSHKNCKGVIHGVANRCLLARRAAEQEGDGSLTMSGEDLSNVGPIALPQDLAVQATLGNVSVERNGHHYFAGLSGWPEEVWPPALLRYPELYVADATGCPRVNLEHGHLNLRSVNQNAFGAPDPVDLRAAGECWLEQE